MSSGRPDFHPTALLEGKYGSSLVPVLVDATGQMYIVMTGQSGIVVKLDADGNLYTRVKGVSGGSPVDVAVDSTGAMISRLKGIYSGALTDVALDTNGFLSAILKGLYDSTLKTIAVDTDGIMKANLSVQSLDYLKVRPTYGPLRSSGWLSQAIDGDSWGTLTTITGKGVVFGGVFELNNTCDLDEHSVKVTTDDAYVLQWDFEFAQHMTNLSAMDFPFRVISNRAEEHIFLVTINHGITFESKFLLQFYNEAAGDQVFTGYLFYALVP